MDIVFDSQLEEIVKIINATNLEEIETDKLCSLIDNNVVKLQVNGVSLLSYYLETSRFPRLGEVRAFTEYGADVNAQDTQGRTPLHWFVGRHLPWQRGKPGYYMFDYPDDNAIALTYRMLNGANPCLLDNDGNNVLMLAIINEQPQTLIEAILSQGQQVNRQLIDQKNNLGYNAVDLYFRSKYMLDGLPFSRLAGLNPDPTATDHHGNNYLHNLFLRPVEKYKRTVDYNGKDSHVSEKDRSPVTRNQLIPLLEIMAGTMKVDITHKNKDGLIPLQVALESVPPHDGICQSDLGCLVPADETVLSKLVPKDLTNDPFSLASKVWFVARLTKYGLDFKEGNVLATCMPTNYSTSLLVEHLLLNGATPRISDIRLAIELKMWQELGRLTYHMLDDEIVNIDDDSRAILVRTLLSLGWKQYGASFNLLSKGLPLRAQDFNAIASAADLETLNLFIDYFTPELVVELNAQSPNLLENINSIRSDILKFIERLVKIGLKVTIGCFKNAFNTASPLAIHTLLQYSNNMVNGQLKQSMPLAHQLLFNMYPKIPDNIALSRMTIFNDCMEFLVDCGISVTLDDLKNILDLNEPLILHQFLSHLNVSYKDEVNIRFPNILVRVLEHCSREERQYNEGLVGLVKDLLDWFNIDINFVDPSLGTALHQIITLFVVWPQHKCKDIFRQILEYVVKQKELDINKVQLLPSDRGQPKRIRIESNPLQLALNHGLVNVVNCLLMAGANCQDFEVIDLIKGQCGAATTFSLMRTLGYPVELSQLYVDNASDSYMVELEKLSKWLEVESRRMKTLKELTAMRVKRAHTRLELNAFVDTIELCPEIKEMFQLKHMVKLM